MVRVSGFGQTGPYAPRAGYGAIGEAMGGLRYIVGESDRPPARVGISIGDSLAASYATMGTLAALRARDISGEGQVIDCAIYESVLAMMESLVTEYYKTDYIRQRSGSRLPNIAPSNVYPTQDGEVLIAANQDTVFRRLVELMKQPELADDPAYKDHVARGEHEDELDEIITRWSRQHNSAELLKMLHKGGVPAGKIFTASDMLENEHFKARNALVPHHHPVVGDLMMQNVVPRFSATPGSIRSPAPELGEHNQAIYQGLLQLSDEKFQQLQEDGVI